jgi:DNA transposition AAA+ family ATPase
MTDETKPRKWSDAEVEALRGQVNDLLRREDLTRRQAADESGIKYGTLTPWLGGTYAGDCSRIAEQLVQWMDARGKRAAIRAVLPQIAFVATPTSEAIHSLLHHAQSLPDMVVVTGAPGTGKTFAVCEFTKRTPNVFKLVADPSLNSVRALLGALANLLGTYDAGSQYRISRAVTQRLTGISALIIVDEAQHLTSAMLDQLRAFHDQAGCGIALVGNEAVIGRLEGGRRSAEFAQLYSRVGMRMRRPRPHTADVEALLDAWQVEDTGPRGALKAVARQAGGLRSMNKTWRLASMLARSEGRALTAADVDVAWRRLAASPVTQEAA